jgi:hypothetical protein
MSKKRSSVSRPRYAARARSATSDEGYQPGAADGTTHLNRKGTRNERTDRRWFESLGLKPGGHVTIQYKEHPDGTLTKVGVRVVRDGVDIPAPPLKSLHETQNSQVGLGLSDRPRLLVP